MKIETFKNQAKKHHNKFLTMAIIGFILIFAIGTIWLFFYLQSLKNNVITTETVTPKAKEETTKSDGNNTTNETDSKYITPTTEGTVPEGWKEPPTVKKPPIPIPK